MLLCTAGHVFEAIEPLPHNAFTTTKQRRHRVSHTPWLHAACPFARCCSHVLLMYLLAGE